MCAQIAIFLRLVSGWRIDGCRLLYSFCCCNFTVLFLSAYVLVYIVQSQSDTSTSTQVMCLLTYLHRDKICYA